MRINDGYEEKEDFMSRLGKLAFAIIIPFCMATIAAQAESEASSGLLKLSPAQGSHDLGLIFSTNNLLLAPEGYQGGIGAKIGWGTFALRAAVDLVLNGSSQSTSVLAGAAGEYHLAPGPVSPYVGGFLQAGYMQQSNTLSVVPITVGALAGVEVFVFDFLSLFAEYSLSLTVTATTDLQSSQTTVDYLVQTGVGNGSKLGIVIYFTRIGARK
jgi:hypothetical protein